ncbi:Minor allergen Alt a 7 [Pleurotus ostreatus]|uniref:Minor allergen Alt a 7 n=2 Tax=Pleurotus ostreatus TaxID=5322 RepID=A0A8H7DV45_PLEOS|nr:Minor allergen Alt a 7 [Pleurotus ostreatus]KAF7430217.1 Minor allergen Alt a 7 [Pleurotus ostreatus]KAJ8701297.1 Minor allergen Alt a 7 [Pleurotus ostreatus]
MCFPSKRQKDYFADKSTAAPQNGTKGTQGTAAASSQPPPTEVPPSIPLEHITVDEQPPTMAPKIAIVTYSMYGHINTLADAILKGIKEAGGSADRYQVPETLPQEILTKMYAPAKADIPIITPEILATYDAFIFGIPTRYGNFPAQWKAFWDSTGALWASGALAGKYASVFISTAGQGGGQESTAIASLSTLTHHGLIYVPFGYAKAFKQLSDLSEVHGGSPWGSGTFAGPDGSRQPSALELEIATLQGQYLYEVVSKVKF